MLNETSLDTLCASLSYALGIEPPKHANSANPTLNEYIDRIFNGEKADRLFMYNPDAVAQWIYEKYSYFCDNATAVSDIKIPLCTVMPSVTPVCFGTMYTGAQPEVHGIRKYEKPVLKIDTFFDALLRAGKKVAIIASRTCSIGSIFLERDLDYFHCGIDEGNAIAAELILKDEHDVIVLYNGNYDSVMHKFGPESPEALAELRANSRTFATISNLIQHNWKSHNTLVGFAMDHGCHEIDGGCGSHGLDMEEDLNIVHLYKGYKKAE
jgi:predicted AlkP superfamily pyrophosphatase or phosphodiesterase